MQASNTVPPIPARLRRLAGIAAIFVLVLGILVVVGWLFDIAYLKSLLPGLVTMKFNTAVAFVLASAALLLRLNQASQAKHATLWLLAELCALVVVLIGLLTLAENLFGWNLGIDQLLIAEARPDIYTIHPGRMGVNASLSFILLGGALLSMERENPRTYLVTQTFALGAGTIGLLALVGYIYNVDTLFGLVASFTAVALHSTVAFLSLAVGLLCVHPTRGFMQVFSSPRGSGILARRLFVAAILGPIFISILTTTGERFGLYDAPTESALAAVAMMGVLAYLVIATSRGLEHVEAQREDITNEIERRNHELSVLYTISRSTGESIELDALLEQAIETTRRTLDVDACAIYLLEPDGKTLRLQVQHGASEQFAQDAGKMEVGEGTTGTAAALRKTVILDLEHYPTERLRPVIERAGYRLVAGIPLLTRGELVGVLNILSSRPREFPVHELDSLATIGQLLGGAIQNARLYQQVQQELREREHAEDELARLVEELKRSNADLEQFAYVASHDLQEPLRMVASYTQLLSRRYRGQLDEKADQYIDFAVDGATRMQQLINDLLAFSRVSTRAKAHERTSCADAVTQALKNLHAAIVENQAVITSDPLPVLPADPLQVTLLFQNLIGNAIKFHGERTPEIHIAAQPQRDRRAREWLFSVRDNGIGIEPQYYERIFVIFQRLHGKHEYAGTGIGLALCKKIVERHGGRIWVESVQGQGTTFFFTLPGYRNEPDTLLPVATSAPPQRLPEPSSPEHVS